MASTFFSTRRFRWAWSSLEAKDVEHVLAKGDLEVPAEEEIELPDFPEKQYWIHRLNGHANGSFHYRINSNKLL